MSGAAPVKVLVVDDIKDIVETVAIMLERRGFRVETAFNGRAALTAVYRERPDVILLNYMMPGLSGRDVLRRLRADARNARIRVLITSAHAAPDFPAMVRSWGADGLLRTPYLSAALYGALAHVSGPGPAEFVVGGASFPCAV